MSTYIYNREGNKIIEKATMIVPTDSFDNTYNRRFNDYQQHIASLKSYPCHPSCKDVWKDGKDVTGKYRIEREEVNNIVDGYKVTYIVYPLTTQESEDELFSELYVMLKNEGFLKAKQQFSITRKQQ